MVNDSTLSKAVEAIRQGHRPRARDLLTRLLRGDKENPTYWLWMSSVVESSKERIFCLETALRLDPKNEAARRGLILLGGLPEGESVKPAPIVRRRWESAIESTTAVPPQGLRKVFAHPILRILAFLCVGALLVGLIALGAVASRSKPQAIAVITSTSKPDWTFTPTNTSLPTGTPVVRTPTPPFHGPTPLWMLLDATYTPTPLYINTPHPITEAYSAGIRALGRGNWSSMLSFMLQASTVDPNAVDTRYYVGEAFRMQGQLDQALQAYELAIMLNPAFAPAYLGRARAVLALDPQADVANDLQRAIENDPNLVEAYLERAALLVGRNQPETALPDLQQVENLQPSSPLLYAWRSLAELQLGQFQEALQDARRAHEMDFTLLFAYKALGQAYLETGDFESARENLQTYLLYEDQEPFAWLLLGQSVFEEGQNYPAAIGYFDQAISLDAKMADAYTFRGLSYLYSKKPQQAVNDFVTAQSLDPESFEICANLGQALFEAERQNDSFRQLNSCQGLALSDQDLATLYFWRGQALESLGNLKAAGQDWAAFLALPEDTIPQEWLPIAREHYLAIFPPTVTPTPTVTIQPTTTDTPTITPTPSIPTATASPTLTITARLAVSTSTSLPAPPSITVFDNTRTPTPGRTRTPTKTPTPGY